MKSAMRTVLKRCETSSVIPSPRAAAAGARVLEPLEDKFYGLRTYTVEDCEGHRWSFESPLTRPAPEEKGWKRNEGRGA